MEQKTAFKRVQFKRFQHYTLNCSSKRPAAFGVALRGSNGDRVEFAAPATENLFKGEIMQKNGFYPGIIFTSNG